MAQAKKKVKAKSVTELFRERKAIDAAVKRAVARAVRESGTRRAAR